MSYELTNEDKLLMATSFAELHQYEPAKQIPFLQVEAEYIIGLILEDLRRSTGE